MENILIKRYQNQYENIKYNKKKISESIKIMKGGEETIKIESPESLSNRLKDIRKQLIEYEKNKKELNLGELEDTLQQFKEVSILVGEIKNKISDIKPDESGDNNQVINSLQTLKTDLLQNLSEDTIMITMKDKPIIIDAPIDITKEQLKNIGDKFTGDYQDIKQQILNNPDKFSLSIQDIDTKIATLKEVIQKYQSDLDFIDSNMRDLLKKTAASEFNSNDIVIISNKTDDMGPDIVSLENYITDVSKIKSSEIKANIDKALQQIQTSSPQVKDEDFSLPDRSKIPIIADPTFSKEFGAVYIDSQKKQQKSNIESQLKTIQGKINQLNSEIQNISNPTVQLTEREQGNLDFLNQYKEYLEKDTFVRTVAKITDNKNKYVKTINKKFNPQLNDSQIKELIAIRDKIEQGVSSSKLLSDLKKISSGFTASSNTKKNSELYEFLKEDVNKGSDGILYILRSQYYFLDNQTELEAAFNKKPKVDNTLLQAKNTELQQLQAQETQVQAQLSEVNKSLYSLQGGGASVAAKKLIDDQNIMLEKSLEYSKMIKTLKEVLAAYYKKVNQYNKLYIQITFYQMFLLLSTTNQLTSSNSMMYKYISIGTCQYYRRILDILIFKMGQKGRSDEINYFKKYHFILINKLYNFLGFVVGMQKAKDETGKDIEVKKTSNIDIEKCKPEIKNMFHLLNLFKDILENYKQLFQDKVSIFARINDFANPKETTAVVGNRKYTKNIVIDKRPEDQIIFAKNNDQSDILSISSEKCEKSLDSKNYFDKLNDKYKNINQGIQFAEVFDSVDFPDNDTLSLYMGLSSQLSQKKGTMLLTYGYSGVGKTVTLFGNKKKNIYGLLQRTLLNIKGQSKIMFRVFEIYGKGFKYFFYWNQGEQQKTHQFIYNYKFTKSGEKLNLSDTQEFNDDEIPGFVGEINNLSADSVPDSYIEIDYSVFKGFDELVDQIDDKRLETGRIKATVNNPSSSRSIVIYEFQIMIDGTYVPFIVMDLPGKENIIKTFVDLDDDFNIYRNQTKDKLFRASMFLDPMYLPTLQENYASFIIEYVRNNYGEIFNWWVNNYQFISVNLKDGSRIDNNFSQSNKNQNNYMPKISVADFKGTNLEEGIHIQYTATELIKFLIENSYFSVIENIIVELYTVENPNLAKDPGNIKKLKDLANGAFEGIYINENILGIITYIIKDVMNKDGRKFIEIQQDPNVQLLNGINSNLNSKFGSQPIYSTLEAVTYDFRDLLRKDNNMNINLPSGAISKFSQPQQYQEYLEQIYKKIEKSYDYSKTYNYDNPLIAKILKPYLDKLENYYMFYLLTNNDPDFKCEKQMKLLDVSLKFIQAMNPKL